MTIDLTEESTAYLFFLKSCYPLPPQILPSPPSLSDMLESTPPNKCVPS